MKKMLVLVLIFVTFAAFAQDPTPLQQMTLAELSEAEGIRQEKLVELILPIVDDGQLKLPLEKIDPRITTGYIETVMGQYKNSRSLRDVAEDTAYPIKKLRNIMGADIPKTGYDKPLAEFGISPQQVNRAIARYEAGESDFLWSITATGMIIVFIALIITGLVVALLEYFHRLDIQQRLRRKSMAESEPVREAASEVKRRRRQASLRAASKKIPADDGLDAPTVAAIAAAIRLHESSLEEANRILATWTKASVSVWKTSRRMPNLRYFGKR
jgi:hypothetical protein